MWIWMIPFFCKFSKNAKFGDVPNLIAPFAYWPDFLYEPKQIPIILSLLNIKTFLDVMFGKRQQQIKKDETYKP